MKIGLFVNDVATEEPTYTTTRLAAAAVTRGHDVWYLGAADFTLDADASLRARAWRVPSTAAGLDTLLDGAADDEREVIAADELDVLLLRNDPAEDLVDRQWAQTAGVLFGERIARRGVLVLNDPVGLGRALTKLYLDAFPEEIRPATMVTRSFEDVRGFVEAHGGRAVLKPLQGSKGHGVFLVQPEDDVNLEQMVEALTRDGYLIAQEYVDGAAEGDVRLFMLDGRPLCAAGQYAAFRRVPPEGQGRANMHAGARAAPAEVNDELLHIARVVGPRLVEDGMFLVGLDVAGGRLLEINVFSPGGLGSAERMTGVDFAPVVLDAIEHRRAMH